MPRICVRQNELHFPAMEMVFFYYKSLKNEFWAPFSHFQDFRVRHSHNAKLGLFFRCRRGVSIIDPWSDRWSENSQEANNLPSR
jgi:hypothetical protein